MVIINIFYNYLPTRGYHDHDGQINTDRSSGFHGWNFPMASVSLFDVSAPERWIVLVRRWMLWKSYEIIHVSYIYIIRVCVSYSYHIIISSYIIIYTKEKKKTVTFVWMFGSKHLNCWFSLPSDPKMLNQVSTEPFEGVLWYLSRWRCWSHAHSSVQTAFPNCPWREQTASILPSW